MKKGTQVAWTLKSGETGEGETLSDEENGKVLVAIHRRDGADVEMHFVIHCNVTWLTELQPIT